MSFKDKQIINVLNYNNYVVVVSTRDQSYAIDPAEDGIPSKMAFSPFEVETINSKCNAFKSGALRFEEYEEEENYTALRITDWKSILTNDQIKDIILHPTYEGLKKIITIKNHAVFERIRGIYTGLKNDPSYDIYGSVDRVITARFKELNDGIMKSEIVIKQSDGEDTAKSADNELSKENTALRSEVEELKKMLEKLLSNGSAVAGGAAEDTKPPRKNQKKVSAPE